MTSRSARREMRQAFAIVRVDLFGSPAGSWAPRVAVTRVVWSQAEAEEEVARLQSIAAAECEYFWRATRVEPWRGPGKPK